MQIIVPMSGFGERFRRAGYSKPKPLIEIDGKPIIAHVIDMFPGEQDFIFVCNQDHLDNPDFQMAETLRKFCPTGRIVGIPSHKLGPVYAVSQVADLINDDSPVIVNYCDFTCYWDWVEFKSFLKETNCDGAIPAYKGFHPHTLGSTNYAYMREMNGWVQDIQEKQPYTDNRMDEYASSGTYYFVSGAMMKSAFARIVEQELNVGGEYYVSLAYKPLLKDGLSIAVYPLQHFMQWGTPDDVREYNGWSAAFRAMLAPGDTSLPLSGSVIVPMAGLGQRFANEGYSVTKPLIPVSGKSMVTQAVGDLPPAQHYSFVLRSDMPEYSGITQELRNLYPDAVVTAIPGVTEGQACTALLGLDALERTVNKVTGPITVGACDNGALFDPAMYQACIDNLDADIIVWTVRGHANAIRKPHMFGWVDAEHGKINGISVKMPLDNPALDPIVIGCFTFRRPEDFRNIVDHLIARDGRINGEFYIDSCINDAIQLGLKCYLFEVDHFISWGTPDDLRTFEYWQSCFHKWEGHPYRLELDKRVAIEALASLEERYAAPQVVVPEAYKC